MAGAGEQGRREAGFRGLAGRFGVFWHGFAGTGAVSAGGGGVSAGRAGLLARVMTAGAVRVTVSFGLAWPNVLGDLDLRGRWRSRSVTVRCFAIWLVRAW